jgi:hypothetical protein
MFLTSTLFEGESSTKRPVFFIPGKETQVIHWIEGWVGHKCGLETVKWRIMSSFCRQLKSVRPDTAVSTELFRMVNKMKKRER